MKFTINEVIHNNKKKNRRKTALRYIHYIHVGGSLGGVEISLNGLLLSNVHRNRSILPWQAEAPDGLRVQFC